MSVTKDPKTTTGMHPSMPDEMCVMHCYQLLTSWKVSFARTRSAERSDFYAGYRAPKSIINLSSLLACYCNTSSLEQSGPELLLCIDIWHLHTSELAGNGKDLATQVLVVPNVSQNSIANHCCKERPMSVGLLTSD